MNTNNLRRIKRKNNNRRNQRSAYSLTRDLTLTTTEPGSFGFIKPRILTTLKYHALLPLSAATGAGGQYLFRLGSLYDPDFTGTGHQPYGFDALAGIYTRYRVLRTKWKIIFTGTSDVLGCLVVPVNGTLNAAITNNATFSAAAEVPRAVSKILGYGGVPPAVFEGNVALNELGGSTLVQYKSDDRFQAQVTADPVETLYMYLGYLNTQAVGTIAFSVDVTLWYEAELFDPVIQAQS